MVSHSILAAGTAWKTNKTSKTFFLLNDGPKQRISCWSSMRKATSQGADVAAPGI